MFAHCYPILDKSQERDFRKVVDSRLIALERKKLLPLGSSRRAVVQSAGGERFESLVSTLSTTALKQLSLRHPAHTLTHSLVAPVRNAFNSSPANFAKHLRTRIAAERIVFARTAQVGQGSAERWAAEVSNLKSRVQAYNAQAEKLRTLIENQSNNIDTSTKDLINQLDNASQAGKNECSESKDKPGAQSFNTVHNTSCGKVGGQSSGHKYVASSAQLNVSDAIPLDDEAAPDIKSPAIAEKEHLSDLCRTVQQADGKPTPSDDHSQEQLGNGITADLSASDDDCKDDALTQLLHFSAATAEDRAVMDKILGGFSNSATSAFAGTALSASQYKEPVDIVQVIAHASHQLRLATEALRNNESFTAIGPLPSVAKDKRLPGQSEQYPAPYRREDVSDMSCESILSLDAVGSKACSGNAPSHERFPKSPQRFGTGIHEPQMCADEDVDVEINDPEELDDEGSESPRCAVERQKVVGPGAQISDMRENRTQQLARTSLLRHRAVMDSSSQLAELAAIKASSVRHETRDLLRDIAVSDFVRKFDSMPLNSDAEGDAERSRNQNSPNKSGTAQGQHERSPTPPPPWMRSTANTTSGTSDRMSSPGREESPSSGPSASCSVLDGGTRLVKEQRSVSSSLSERIMFFNALDAMHEASELQSDKKTASELNGNERDSTPNSVTSRTAQSIESSSAGASSNAALQTAAGSSIGGVTSATSNNRGGRYGAHSAAKQSLVSALSPNEKQPKQAPKTVRFAKLPPPFVTDGENVENSESEVANVLDDGDGITWTRTSPIVPTTGSYSVTYGVDGVPIEHTALLSDNVLEGPSDSDLDSCASSSVVEEEILPEDLPVDVGPQKVEKTIKNRIERRSTPRKLGRLLISRASSEIRSASSRSPSDSGSLLTNVMQIKGNDLSVADDAPTTSRVERADLGSKGGAKLKPSGSGDMESTLFSSKSGLSYIARTFRGNTADPGLKHGTSASSASEFGPSALTPRVPPTTHSEYENQPQYQDDTGNNGQSQSSDEAPDGTAVEQQHSAGKREPETQKCASRSVELNQTTSDAFRRRLFLSPESKPSPHNSDVVLESSLSPSDSFRSSTFQQASRSKSDIMNNPRYVHFANGTDKSTRLLLSSGDGHDAENFFSGPLHNRRAESDILSDSSPGLRSSGARDFFTPSVDAGDTLRPLTRSSKKSSSKSDAGRPIRSPMNRIKALRDRLRRLA